MNHPQSAHSPWQPQEKLELLTEVIRQSRIPPEALAQFIHNNGITPNWGDMALPRGRSYNQCTAAYEEVMRPRTSLMRSTSVRDIGSSTAMKRPFIHEGSSYGGRMIQPRPEGAPLINPREASEPPKKKRGRPTKVEAEERRQAAILRGEVYPTPRRPSATTVVAGPSSTAASAAAAAAASASAATAAATRPPSVAAAQAAYGPVPRAVRTPPPQPGPPSSESSSGKRRRGRSSKIDEESRSAQESFAPRPGPSRYPDILSRDEAPEPRFLHPRTGPALPPTEDPSGPR